MAPQRTAGQAQIDAKLSTLDPGTPRYRVLAAARDFKASWVELGERLTEVCDQGLFQQWGYSSFEAYCRAELRIKRETAHKLTRSFSFLREHEPVALRERQQSELPPLDVVDMLSQARERAKVSDDEVDAIRQEVFAPDASFTRQQVMKRFREIDPDAFKSAQKAKPSAEPADSDVRKVLLLAERLQTLLRGHPGVAEEALDAMTVVVKSLRGEAMAVRKLSA